MTDNTELDDGSLRSDGWWRAEDLSDSVYDEAKLKHLGHLVTHIAI